MAYYVQTKNILNPRTKISGLNCGGGLYIESGIVDYTLAIKPIYVNNKLSGFTINEGNPIPQDVLLEAYQNRDDPDNHSLQILKRSIGAARYLPENIIRSIVNSINRGIKKDEYIFHFDSSVIHEFFEPEWNGLKIRRTDQPHTENRMVGTRFLEVFQSYTPRRWSARDLKSVQSYGPPPGLQRKGYSMWNGRDIGKDVRLHSKGYSMWNGRDIGKDVRDPVGMDDIDSQERMVADLVGEDSRGGRRKSKRSRSSKKSNTKKAKRKSHKKK